MPAPTPSIPPALPNSPTTASDFIINRGQCAAMYAYDVGFAVDLNKAAALLAAERETLKHSRRAPKYFEYQPAPVRVTRVGNPVTIGRFTTQPAIDALVFDFGAISISFTIPLTGPIEDLLHLSSSLYENATLLAEARRVLDDVVRLLAPAINKPDVAMLVEDYVVFDIDEWQASSAQPSLSQWIDGHGSVIARILRSDIDLLSRQEIEDATNCRISYAESDAALIDWNAALLFGREMQDVMAVLEFANVELLEMRFLDDQLDRSLAEAYEASQKTSKLGFFDGRGADLQRISRLQIDSAVLFEGVNNALKLLGDVYLSRVYRLAAARLHLPDWDASIIRKLGTLESIYGKLNDRQANRRMEVLEWIIIALILFEVVMSFVRH